jgi:trehalose synthase-fused probable maltokinase
MDDSRRSTNGRNPLPQLPMAGGWDWETALSGALRGALENALALGLARQRWFGSKTRTIRAARAAVALAIASDARLLLVEVEFASGPAELYQLPLTVMPWDRAQRLAAQAGTYLWARAELLGTGETVALVDATADETFCRELLRLIECEARLRGDNGELVAHRTDALATARGDAGRPLASRVSQAEQSNTSIVFGERLILKLLRRLEEGPNPDLEINMHLAQRGFAHVPPLAGSIEFRRASQEPWSLAMLQQYVVNRGDAWQVVLSRLSELLDARAGSAPPAVLSAGRGVKPLVAASRPIPAEASSALAPFLADADRLGRRTAELHLALADAGGNPAFEPRPITRHDLEQFSERTRATIVETFELLRQQAARLPGDVQARARDVLPLETAALEKVAGLADRPADLELIRIHGDYHLGQVLVTDDDVVIIDFEGEPARPLAERRQKQLALRDVAGMMRSFHYASCAAAAQCKRTGAPDRAAPCDAWSAASCYWMSAAFLAGYLRTIGGAAFLPRMHEDVARLLDACLLEKAVYELRYELNHRPDWVHLPLAALAELVG